MREDFDKWVELWAKAQQDGIFEDAPKPPVPSSQTSDPASYFGPINTRHTADVKDCDVQYWNDVFALSQGGEPQVFTEAKKTSKDVAKDAAKEISRSPNPVHPSSVGPDQELTPESQGLTFSEKDIERLSELKLQLHDLTSKMASFLGEGKSAKQLENKIVTLKKQIDEFSNELSRSLGEKKSSQGTELSPL